METVRRAHTMKFRIPDLISAGCVFMSMATFGVVLTKAEPPELFVSRHFELAQIAPGRSIYESRCASCHGKNLQGQPNWKTPSPNGRLPAPPHDASGHTWHHPDRVLIGVTKNGLKPYAGSDYESDMPAFGDQLTDQEIESVIAYIKSTWPERERQYQDRVSRESQPSQ